jgi:hypothetical protein
MDEMCLAIRRKRKPSSSKPLPKANVALADQYQEAVTRPFSKGVAVKVRCAEWSAALEDFFQCPLYLLCAVCSRPQDVVVHCLWKCRRSAPSTV